MFKKSVFVLSTLVFSGLCAASAAPVDSSEQPKVLLVLSPASPLVKKIVNSGLLTSIWDSYTRAGAASFTVAAAINGSNSSNGGIPSEQTWIECDYQELPIYDATGRFRTKVTYSGCTVYQGSFADKNEISKASYDELQTLTVVDVLNLAGELSQSSAAE